MPAFEELCDAWTSATAFIKAKGSYEKASFSFLYEKRLLICWLTSTSSSTKSCRPGVAKITFAISATLQREDRQKLKLLKWKLKEEKRNLASVLQQAANMIPLFLSKTTGDLWKQAFDERLASDTHVEEGREVTNAKAR